MDSSFNPETVINQLYQQANYQLAQQQVEQAIALCQTALSLNQDFAPIHKTLGVAWQLKNDLEQAKFWYKKALETQPDYAEVYANLGSLYAQQQQWENAVLTYRKAIKVNPELAGNYRNLAKVLTQLNQLEEADECWYTALKLEPEWATLTEHLMLGNKLFKQKKVEQAVVCYLNAIQAEPNGFEPYHNLGEAYSQLQQWENAINAYTQSLDRNREFVQSYMGLGNAYQQQGNWQAAINCYQELIKVTPNSYQPYFQIAEVWFKLQNWDAAIVAYHQALEFNDKAPFIYLALSRVFGFQQNWDEAIRYAQKALELNPHLPHSHSHLGNFFKEKGEIETAIQFHQKSHQLRGWNQSITNNYQFTKDWFSLNIPIWQQFLKEFANLPNIQGLEIGSFQGMSACWLLDHILTHPTAKLTCIDLGFQPEFDLNLARTNAAEKVIKSQGFSEEILPTLVPDTYNFIYVDGCHLTSAVMQDAFLSWPLLKAKGLMIFDDYEYRDPENPDQDTKKGIEQFLATIPNQFEIVHKAYQLILKKKS